MKPFARRLIAVALILVVALTAGACGGSGGSKPRGVPAAANPNHLISIFEAHVELLADPGPVLEQLHRLGVQYVRVPVRWVSVAPAASSHTAPANFDASSPAAYPGANWARYDALDREARADHIGLLFDLTGGAPQWATGPGFIPGGAQGVWRPSAGAFGAFAQAVGTRYSGDYTPPGARSPLPRVSFWSVWNEPNLGEADLAPQATDDSQIEASAVMYRGLLDAAWGALHRTGHGGDAILIGDLAPLGQTVGTNVPGTFGEMVPMRFVRALYCVDAGLRPLRGAAAAARACPTTGAGSQRFAQAHPALFEATGFAVHPYAGPTRIPPTAVLSPDDASLANLPKLEQTLGMITAEYGHGRRFGLWNTEYGYITDPPFPQGAPLAVAAAYENQAEYIGWRDPWMRSWDHYGLVDPPAQGSSHFFTGLESANGTPKPTYDSYRMPIYLPVTRAQHGTPLEVWGCVRPVNTTASPPPAELQFQPAGGGAFKTIRSVQLSEGSCYFDVRVRFPSAGTVRVAWAYPGGSLIYSRLVAITAS